MKVWLSDIEPDFVSTACGKRAEVLAKFSQAMRIIQERAAAPLIVEASAALARSIVYRVICSLPEAIED
jgi:hypothetical protein